MKLSISLAAAGLAAALQTITAEAQTTSVQGLFEELRQIRGLDETELRRIREIHAGSQRMGRGNPEISRYAMTIEACRARAGGDAPASYASVRFERICGEKFMAPLYDPRNEHPEDTRSCIDQFEYPNIPCGLPLVWVTAREAAQLCEAEGKRLCDAHEWEGACAGRLEPPDYRFDLANGVPANIAVQRMRRAHNAARSATRAWAYGPEYQPGTCAANSAKSSACGGNDFEDCGSNTFPAGSFPDCAGPLAVYDLHGNVAEHMNLPLAPVQMASKGSRALGVTEMKGSWFIWDNFQAHPDWCRWRAPFWHGTRVMDERSHANYNLGFRCCKSLP